MADRFIRFADQAFEFLPDRALFWAATRTLILSDLHVGKAAVFRARGLAIPTGITTKDLERVSALIAATNATRVLILGDFLHAKESHDAASHVERWRDRHRDIAVEIVPGNHDRTVGLLDPALGFVIRQGPYVEGGIAFVHDPAEVHALPVMGGHVHPQVRLGDFDGSGLSVPAFVVEERVFILPAFGSFTGGCRLVPDEHRRLFAAAAGRVIEVTAAATRPAATTGPWSADAAGRTIPLPAGRPSTALFSDPARRS